MSQGNFLFESCPGSVGCWKAFLDVEVVRKHSCFLYELLAGHDDLFWGFGMVVCICVVHLILDFDG